IHPEAMQSHVQHLEGLLQRHVAETESVWAEEILGDLRSFLPKFWVAKPKAASIDSLIENLRRAASESRRAHGRQESAVPRHPTRRAAQVGRRDTAAQLPRDLRALRRQRRR